MTDERYFSMLFEYAPIALMEQDFSPLRLRFEALRAQGVSDLGAYLDSHPEEIETGMTSIQLIRANRQALTLYGVKSKEEFLAHIKLFFRDEMRRHFRDELLTLWRGELSWAGEGVNYALDGRPIDVLLSWRILPGSEKTWEQVLVSIEDVTRRKKAERALQASEAHLRGMFENAPISLWEEDFSPVKAFFDSLRREGVEDLRAYFDQHPETISACMRSIRALDVNRETLRLFGASSKEQLLGSLDKVFREKDETEGELLRLWRDELICLWDGDLTYEAEGVNYTLQGEMIYVRLHLAVYPGAEQTLDHVLVSIEDVTARRKAEEYLRYLGSHDVMTGLYTRAYFQEEMKRLGGGRYYPISVLVADLDGLKQANDNLGHKAGDKLIRRAAEVLKAGFRKEDAVARIGGDEFAVLMPQTDAEAAAQVIIRLESLINLNNKYYGKPTLSLSLGVATGEDHENLEEVLRRADDAMYRMKREHHRKG